MNGIRRFGAGGQRQRSMQPLAMAGPDYQASLQAARQALRDRLAGLDPTDGATRFNMRTDAKSARGGDFYGDRPHTVSGPYRSPTPYRWSWTYGK